MGYELHGDIYVVDFFHLRRISIFGIWFVDIDLSSYEGILQHRILYQHEKWKMENISNLDFRDDANLFYYYYQCTEFW